LTRPTHDRLVKIFSYLINFVRFRESQTPVIDEHFNKTEKTKARIDQLLAENQEMEQRLAEMRRGQQANEIQVREKVARNDALKARLRELGAEQSRVAETLDRVKGDRARRQQQLEEKTERTVRSRQEAEKLRPYVLESPATLQSSLTELAENLMREKAQIDAMERRARALQTSSDTFTVVSNDVQACVKLLDDISTELQKEEEEEARAARNKDAISDKGNTVREVEQTEKLLQRQLVRWQERIEALRKSAQEKAEVAQIRMEELRNVQKQLREERAEKQRDMERRRIRIEQTEKKVSLTCTPADIIYKLTHPLDGRSQREHRERDSSGSRPISQTGVPHQALHHRDGEIVVRPQFSWLLRINQEFSGRQQDTRTVQIHFSHGVSSHLQFSLVFWSSSI
jgi:kinetochore protein Nuf2